jgi:type I restriction enzyme M protein
VTINELLNNSKDQFSLDIFSLKNIAAVEAALVERNGRYYLKCCARTKEVLAKPEEIIRQLWLQRLQNEFKYPSSRLAVEYPITFGRDSSKRADIVVFDPDRPTVPYIIIEVKQPTEKGGKDQLKSYCHATGAPLAL